MSKAIAEGPPSIELRAKQNQPATASATAKRSELHPRATTSMLVAARQSPHHGSAQRPDIRLSLTGHHSCRATLAIPRAKYCALFGRNARLNCHASGATAFQAIDA